MKINCLGGGPGSMYFAILMKKSFPEAEITIYEQNRNDDTFGFGVVFSDKTMENFRVADEPTYRSIMGAFEHWDDIDIHIKGQVLKSTGHGFAGMSRVGMLMLMQDRCKELGIDMHFQERIEDPETLRDCDLLFAADGVNSITREKYKDKFQPDIDFRPNRFVWLGTDFNFPAFTFHFIENEHGLWRTHCYRYQENMSTLIIECTEETLAKTGLGITDEDATADYVAKLLKDYIPGGKVIKNRSHWRSFPNIQCGNWNFDNVVSPATRCTRPTSRSAPAPSWRWKMRSRSTRRSPKPARSKRGCRNTCRTTSHRWKACSAPPSSRSAGSRKRSATTTGWSRSSSALPC